MIRLKSSHPSLNFDIGLHPSRLLSPLQHLYLGHSFRLAVFTFLRVQLYSMPRILLTSYIYRNLCVPWYFGRIWGLFLLGLLPTDLWGLLVESAYFTASNPSWVFRKYLRRGALLHCILLILLQRKLLWLCGMASLLWGIVHCLRVRSTPSISIYSFLPLIPLISPPQSTPTVLIGT